MKKLTCLLLCITMLALPLFSCGTDPSETPSAPAASGTDSDTGEEPTVYVADVPGGEPERPRIPRTLP